MRCWDACFLFSSNFFKGKTSLANQGEIKDLPPCCSLFNWPEEKEVPVMYGSCSFWFQSRAITAGLAVGELACESSASWKSSNRWPAQEQMENCCGLCHCEIVDIKEFQARFHCFSLAFSICLWKNVRRVNKNMRRVCQPPLVCDLCVGYYLLDVTYCSQCFIHFIFYLTPPKSTFHPQKSENSSLGKSTWRFWVLGTPSQLPTPFLGRSSGWSDPGRVLVSSATEVFTFLALPTSSGQVTEQEEALQKWQMIIQMIDLNDLNLQILCCFSEK